VPWANRILIVDDDPRLCRALARYFKRKGYEVQSANSGREMRQRLSEAEHSGRVLTREAILELVAARDWSPSDRSVDVLIAKLRKKLEDPSPEGPRLIETVRSVGYKLMAKVRFD